jgi:hypothetical protein
MHPIAPELQVASWLNTAMPLSLEQLRGKVVAIMGQLVAEAKPQQQALCDDDARVMR